MLLGKKIQIPIIPGVNPLSDSTELDTIYFTAGDKIRFQFGKLRKMRGCQRIFPINDQQITGFARNIFSYRDAFDNPITIIGTNTRLYAYLPEQGTFFYNITPLQTTTIDIPDAFTTEYNPTISVIVQTSLNSPVITLNINNYFEMADSIQISGVTGGPYNGIPANNFNGTFIVNAISNTQIQITLGASATSTGSVAVIMTWASSYLYVNYPDNGLPDGDRIKILGSTDVNGIPAASINIEHIITNVVDTNNFIIQTDTIATSGVAAGGGADTTIQTQIASGNVNENYGYGFGAGLFGFGEFGADQFNISNDGDIAYPRIWSMDNIGANLILTPGDPATNSTDNLYLWQNDISVAPVLISGLDGASSVPLANKWVYVSNNIAITLGAGGFLNQFASSDVVSVSNQLPVIWASGAATYGFSTLIANAAALISQSKSRNFDLIFTQAEVYYAEFVDKPDIWFFRKLFSTDGIIGPKARAIIEDAVFWMGQGDFYVFDGYTVNVLPNNTVKRHVYDNINQAQAFKCFAYANVEWSEVWFFYPKGIDKECNNYVIYNYKEQHWSTGTWMRSAAEERVNANVSPLLIQSSTNITTIIGNNINTYFFNLAANPISVSDGENIVTVSIDTNLYLQIGDHIFISNSTDVGGIIADNINGEQIITSVTYIQGAFGEGLFGAGTFGGNNLIFVTQLTFTAASDATSTTTGGGNIVTVGTAILGVAYSGANGLSVGEIVSINNATAIDGFPALAVNSTAPIRYISSGLFQMNVNVSNLFSTSNATGGGVAANIIIADNCRLFEHETGVDDYNNNFNLYTDSYENQFAPLNSYAQTNYAQIEEGDETYLIYSMYPDIRMQEDMSVTVNVKEYAQSPYIHTQIFNITPTTTKIDPMMIGRERQYIFTSNILEGDYLIGRMFEEIKPSTPR